MGRLGISFMGRLDTPFMPPSEGVWMGYFFSPVCHGAGV